MSKEIDLDDFMPQHARVIAIKKSIQINQEFLAAFEKCRWIKVTPLSRFGAKEESPTMTYPVNDEFMHIYSALLNYEKGFIAQLFSKLRETDSISTEVKCLDDSPAMPQGGQIEDLYNKITELKVIINEQTQKIKKLESNIRSIYGQLYS